GNVSSLTRDARGRTLFLHDISNRRNELGRRVGYGMGDTTKGARRTLASAASALLAFVATWTPVQHAWAEPPPIRTLSVLRVGFPTRPSLLFKCDGWSIKAPATSAAYRSEVSSSSAYALVRNSSGTRADPWPDTLLVQLFEDSTDEEIALERGELDVAVFWPGEGSETMREHPGLLYGSRSNGILAVLPPRTAPGTAFSASDSSAAAALNGIVFRGDLAPLDPSTGGVASNQLPAPVRGDFARLEVDHSCPGWQTIERFVNR